MTGTGTFLKNLSHQPDPEGSKVLKTCENADGYFEKGEIPQEESRQHGESFSVMSAAEIGEGSETLS